jgi:tetratricopeptide (TPR) repeat protein
MKKSFIAAMLCVAICIMTAGPLLRAQETIPAGSLVMDLIKLFQGLSSKPDALKNFDGFAKKYLVHAKELKQKGVIDQDFFVRYLRLLGVVKLVSMDDKDGILAQVMIDAVNQFTITDEKRELKGNEKIGIGLLAASLAEEMISLHGYLMNNLKPNPNVNRFLGVKATPFKELKKVNGIYYYKGTSTPFSGMAVKKFEGNGKTADRMVFQKGKMNGPRVVYEVDGTKIAEGWMSNNVQSGLWLYYAGENNLKEIIDCNGKLRTFYNQFKENVKKGIPAEALKNLDAAIKVKSLAMLIKAKEEFYLRQSIAFSDLKKYEEAIKYMRKHLAQVKKSSRDKVKVAEAYYRLGVINYNRLRDKSLDDEAKLAFVNEGLAALKEALKFNPDYAYPHAYMALFYRHLARLQPAKEARYLELAQRNQQTLKELYNKLRSRTDFASELESIGGEEFPRADRKRKLKGNPYCVKPDDLRQLDFFVSDSLVLPPPPPPPPAVRKIN